VQIGGKYRNQQRDQSPSRKRRRARRHQQRAKDHFRHTTDVNQRDWPRQVGRNDGGEEVAVREVTDAGHDEERRKQHANDGLDDRHGCRVQRGNPASADADPAIQFCPGERLEASAVCSLGDVDTVFRSERDSPSSITVARQPH
jgi:hypothetical protein